MKKGHADLPLHYGAVPFWLAERMTQLGGLISEAIIHEYGRKLFIEKLSDPFWFQSLGCVLGMDWHSSGVTTSVMNALKKAINLRSKELGVYICGGKGKASKKTPDELREIAFKTSLDADKLIKASKLTAKIDNTAIQDGFQLYLHSFILSIEGDWAVVQQGMNAESKKARRYHWLSGTFTDFTQEPHTFIYGENQGNILNLTHSDAKLTKNGILNLVQYNPDKIIREISLIMPDHHQLTEKEVNLKRLGTALILAHETGVENIESLLLLKGVGPRTLQSLTLVSEVIHGTPSRFSDPARFSFAHGGKDGHPFPVPTKIYDETLSILETSLNLSKLGYKEKSIALKNLSKVSQQIEENYSPNYKLKDWIKKERNNSWKYGGKTVMGDAKPPNNNNLEKGYILEKKCCNNFYKKGKKNIDPNQYSLF